MGNPERKESLGAGMTGGQGALPYFNAFMIPFMKGKDKEDFYKTPAMPSDIRALAERRKREEQEKLEKADEAGRNLGVAFSTGTKSRRVGATSAKTDELNTLSPTSGESADPTKPATNPDPPRSDDPPKVIAVPTPARKPDTPPEPPKSEGVKRKGKKGDGEN